MRVAKASVERMEGPGDCPIVKDDLMMRETAAETPRDFGYEIVEIADADTALALLENGTETRGRSVIFAAPLGVASRPI